MLVLKIVFIGNSEGFDLAEVLKEKLCECGNCVTTDIGNQTQTITIEDTKTNEFNEVVVFRSDFNNLKAFDICTNAVCVVNSCSKNNIEYICKSGMNAVTCGLSDKDTFTISGISEEQAAVSLQRTLKTVSGKTIQPCEYVFNLTKPLPRYDIMDLAAVLVLSNNDDILQNITI